MSAAAVIDLSEFRRRKQEEEAAQASRPVLPMWYPMWVCWVPVPVWPVG